MKCGPSVTVAYGKLKIPSSCVQTVSFHICLILWQCSMKRNYASVTLVDHTCVCYYCLFLAMMKCVGVHMKRWLNLQMMTVCVSVHVVCRLNLQVMVRCRGACEVLTPLVADHKLCQYACKISPYWQVMNIIMCQCARRALLNLQVMTIYVIVRV